jgi:hypothetical protein
MTMTNTPAAAAPAAAPSAPANSKPTTAAPAAKAPAKAPAKTAAAKKAPAPKAAAPAKAPAAAPAKGHAEIKVKAIPPTKPKETSFENTEADNPIASKVTPKKSLEEKIRDLAAKSEAKKAAAASKKSAVINPDDGRDPSEFRDASAVASKKSAPAAEITEPEAESEVIEPVAEEPAEEVTEAAAPESEFEQLEGTTTETEVEAEVESAEEPWEPNFKIRSMKFDEQGNAVEFETEIPEKFRGLITDKDSEAELRKIFSAASGIDYVQTRRDQYKARLEQADGFIGKVKERLSGVDSMIEEGDLDSAFDTMKIPQEKVLQWVLDKLEYSKLEPAQRQLVDSQRASEKRAKQLEQDNKSLFQKNLESNATNKAIALDAILDRPDLKPVIAAYDSRPGKQPGAPSFRDLCINHGELTWHRSGGKFDASPNECVDAVLKGYGIEQGYRPAAKTPNPAPKAPQSAAPKAPATTPKTPESIPSVASRAASPTAPRITNMKQLKERIKQVQGL